MSCDVPTFIYTPEQESSLLKKIPAMMQEAETLRDLYVAPNLHQRHSIASMIWAHIHKFQRKVYGGHALSAALSVVSPETSLKIYDHPSLWSTSSFPDIDFYSPDPISDVIDICKRLYASGMSYVQGKEAAHAGSFVITVEFQRVCNVTYVPDVVYKMIPTTLFGPIPMVDPAFSIIDHLKILCDPFTSYWKLDRMMPRMMLLQRFFPMMLPEPKEKRYKGKTQKHNYAEVMRWASLMRTVAVVGEQAVDFFDFNKISDSSDHVTLVSTDYESDVGIFNETFKSEESKRFRLRERRQLMDDLGRTATFYFYDEDATLDLAVSIIDARDKAVPVCGVDPVSSLKISSFSYCLLTALTQHMSARVNGCDAEAGVHAMTASRLLAAKRRRSDVHDHVFRDSSLEYIGNPKSTMRAHMAATDDRKIISSKNAPVWFTFDPSRPSSQGHMSNYVLIKHDGMMIRNCNESVIAEYAVNKHYQRVLKV